MTTMRGVTPVRILLVNDNADTTEALGRLLEGFDWHLIKPLLLDDLADVLRPS